MIETRNKERAVLVQDIKHLHEKEAEIKWYIQALKKYAVFSGRAQRMEYWMFTLFNVIIVFVLGFIEGTFAPANNSDLLGNLCTLGILFPTWAVAASRLHDTGKSGWWQLLGFIPIIG